MSLLKADLTRSFRRASLALFAHTDERDGNEEISHSSMRFICHRLHSIAGVFACIPLYGNDFGCRIACVVYWGIIGGFVSSQRRMERLPSDGDPLIGVFGLDRPITISGCHPCWAHLCRHPDVMFVAGILRNSIPRLYYSGPEEGLSYFEFAWRTLPRASDDYASCLCGPSWLDCRAPGS